MTGMAPSAVQNLGYFPNITMTASSINIASRPLGKFGNTQSLAAGPRQGALRWEWHALSKKCYAVGGSGVVGLMVNDPIFK
jgi:hypothetical protein